MSEQLQNTPGPICKPKDMAAYDTKKIRKRWEVLAPHNDTTLDYALSELFRCLDIIAQLQKQVEAERWIPVSEKLPNTGELVILATDGEVFTGFWYKTRTNVVTHWKPINLPEPAHKEKEPE